MKLRPSSTKSFQAILLISLAFLGGCGKERTVSSEEVEYRKNKKGALVLYRISEESPLTALVYEDHGNGERHFEIYVKNGLRDGNFTFWRDNKIPVMKGAYLKGERHGRFTAYGKAGEMVYEKTYSNGKLNGICRFYYPFSADDVENFFRKMDDEDLEVGELKANSRLRYSCEFKNDVPVGAYKAYDHIGEDENSTYQHLREKGHFDDNGSLIQEQEFYFPEVKALGIKLPDGVRLEDGYEANEKGLASAIKAAYVAIEDLPAYRNENAKPATIFALDDRGNELAPIWNTQIYKLAIRDLNGSFLPKRYDAGFEAYLRAKQRAEDLCDEYGIVIEKGTSRTIVQEVVSDADGGGDSEEAETVLEVVGLNRNGKVIEILWTSNPKSRFIPLEERITRKRFRLVRAWLEGKSWGSKWFLPDGSMVSILEEQSQEIVDRYRKR